MMSVIRLPIFVQRRIDAATRALLLQHTSRAVDFGRPLHEPALVSPDSVSWRIFKNPVALIVGGIAAVVLELADAAVRSGIWEHSSFRADPIGRVRRTGFAAMVTVYGPRSIAEPMIAAVARRHAAIAGITPGGVNYSANDPKLLTWVHATATFAFAAAYSGYVDPLDCSEIDAFYREAAPTASLYGALGAPQSGAELAALFESMRGHLEPSKIVFEFLQIMRGTTVLPRPLRWMQPILVRAAVEMIPPWIRQCLGLDEGYGLRPREAWIVHAAGNLSDRIVLRESPAAQSCVRLGLPENYLYT